MVHSNDCIQAQGDTGPAIPPRRTPLSEEHRRSSSASSESSASPPGQDQELSTGLFGPAFLQGFFVNCSVCRQKNKASAKCYECNSYLCEKCVFSHAKGRSTSYHHIYHFDSLAERLSPTVTGVLSQPTEAFNPQVPPPPPGPHLFSEAPMSRVVGSGRRSSEENSRTSSRTSSEGGGVDAVQAALSAITLTLNSTAVPDTSSVLQQLSPNQCLALVNRPNPLSNPANQGEMGDCMTLALNQLELPPCVRHLAEFKFFCSDCMMPICSGCLQEKHMDHSLVYITEGLQTAGQMSQDLNVQIREMNVGLRHALDGLQRMCENVDYRAHQVAIDVKCTIRRFIKALEARQDDVLQRLEQARQVKQRLINCQMENIRLHYSKLARALDVINDPSRFSSPIENMVANHEAFRELRQARNLGNNIFPCEDDGFMFIPPTDGQLQSIAFLGNLHVSSSPISNSVVLCRQPLLYMNARVRIAEYPLPTAKSRPIFGCGQIVAVKDFGRTPKIMWGKAGPNDGELCRPWGITMNRFGQIIIADRSNNRIQVFDSEGKYLYQFGTHGSRNGQFDRPAAVACSPNDDMVVADKDNHRIQVFNRNGEFLFTFGERGSRIGQFMYPWDVACDSMGNILVSDARNHRIQLFRWNGIFIAKWGGEMCVPRIFDTPRGVAFDPLGNILMTDFNMHRVVMIERATGKVKYIGREGKERGQFNRPQGICCDDRGWFVVADSRNYRFQVFNDKGEFMWMVGHQGKEEPGEFDRPCDMCIDPEGHIHLMDFGNDRIQVF